MTADEIVAAVQTPTEEIVYWSYYAVRTLVDEIVRLRSERDKFKLAWDDVSTHYEALLNQLGGTDA